MDDKTPESALNTIVEVNTETDDFWPTSTVDENGNEIGNENFSPYRFFSAERWAEFRADTPLTLSEEEVDRLRSLNDPISIEEVERIYLALSRLLYSHVEASQELFLQRRQFLDIQTTKTPFIIGVAGSVSVGKSTTARILQQLLARWPSSPKVDLVTTDGFLFSNKKLEELGIMNRKGFPESYDVGQLLRFLSAIKAGNRHVKAPVYSHFFYDVQPNEYVEIDTPDILIFEGINVLQSRDLPKDGKAVPFVSDFFDFSIYIDADEQKVSQWYVERFMGLRKTAFKDPAAFFHRYSKIDDVAAEEIARSLWVDINLVNLRSNILPTRPRADLILKKGADHLVESVALRKI